MSITLQQTFNGRRINTNKDKDLGCYTEILEKHHELIDYMLEKHSKVTQIRFDLRLPEGTDKALSGEELNSFTYNLKRDISRNAPVFGPQAIKESCPHRHAPDPKIMIATEQHDAKQPHYHGVILLNGNARDSATTIFPRIERQLQNILGKDTTGLVDYCNKHGKNPIVIDRNSPQKEEQLQEASNAASYLAKCRGKENRQKGTWKVRASRVPKTKTDKAE